MKFILINTTIAPRYINAECVESMADIITEHPMLGMSAMEQNYTSLGARPKSVVRTRSGETLFVLESKESILGLIQND